MCFHGLVGLGDWVHLPLKSLWQSPPAGLLVCLQHHPHGLLHEWPQLWECWQLPCSCSQLVQPFNSVLQQVGGYQHPLMGLSGLSKFVVIGFIISWSLQDFVSVVGCRGPGGSMLLVSIWHGGTPLWWRHSSTEGQDVLG